LSPILAAILYVVIAPFAGGLLAGVDRKISARMQGRQGPPILQPFYDLCKLFSKESVVVNQLQNLFVIGFLVFIVFTGVLFFSGADLLLMIFALTLASIVLVLTASSANSPYSSMGAQRELMQMMAYEPMVLIVAIAFYMTTGSFSVQNIVSAAQPAIYTAPAVFAGYLYILTIKLRKSPFDLSTSHHAHQEMVKGITTELSGKTLGLLDLAHWYENVFLLGIVALFIVNSSPISWLIGVVVALAAYFLEIVIDNTFARVKWQVMLKSAWIVALIAGVVNLLVISLMK
jgi:ech hydrogenase subunit B